MKKILFIVLLFSLSSCFTHKDLYDNSFQLSSEKDKEIIISLQRTACFGTCPIYKIEIYTDGSGIYTGTRFVEKIGGIEFKLSEEEINSILQKANKINYCQLEDEYFERISDLPRTYVQIFDKKVLDYYGAPKELKELEELIDKICFKHIK